MPPPFARIEGKGGRASVCGKWWVSGVCLPAGEATDLRARPCPCPCPSGKTAAALIDIALVMKEQAEPRWGGVGAELRPLFRP